MKNADVWIKHLEPLFSIYLKDRAAAIRKMGSSKVQELSKIYGSAWLGTFINKLTDIIQKETSYHYKNSAIYSLTEVCLANYDNVEKCVTHIFKTSHDNVPNVREVSVKCLRNIAIKWDKKPSERYDQKTSICNDGGH